jgi:Cu-Zn family superoxide dismutase
MISRTIALFLFLMLLPFHLLAAGPVQFASATFIDVKGDPIGIATLSEGLDGVAVRVHLVGLSPGYHGVHIHEKGVCVAPDFKWAGGHFNPFGAEHGLKNPKGRHVGDLGNLLVNQDGVGTGSFSAPLATLGKGENSLFGKDGTSLVVHADPDDQISQPSGRGGKRVACGVIKQLVKENP